MWADGFGLPDTRLFARAFSQGRGESLHALFLQILTILGNELAPYRFNVVLEFFNPAASSILKLRGTNKVILNEQEERALREFQIPVPLDLSVADQKRVLVRFRLVTGTSSAFPFKAVPVSMRSLGLGDATRSPTWLLLQQPPEAGAVE